MAGSVLADKWAMNLLALDDTQIVRPGVHTTEWTVSGAVQGHVCVIAAFIARLRTRCPAWRYRTIACFAGPRGLTPADRQTPAMTHAWMGRDEWSTVFSPRQPPPALTRCP